MRANRDIAVLRFNADGSKDASFGADGVLLLDLSAGVVNGTAYSADSAWGLAAYDDDRLVISGGKVRDGATDTDFVLIRLTADGVRDESFGTHGVFSLDTQLNGASKSASPRNVTNLPGADRVIDAGYQPIPGAESWPLTSSVASCSTFRRELRRPIRRTELTPDASVPVSNARDRNGCDWNDAAHMLNANLRNLSRQPQERPVIPRLAFPNHEDTPAQLAERSLGAGVALPILPELACPGGPSGFRSGGARAALVAVPEATVNKHHGPVARQDDVGRAGQPPRADAEAEPGPVKKRTHAQFRRSVARADSRHDCASFFLVEYVQGEALGSALARVSDVRQRKEERVKTEA